MNEANREGPSRGRSDGRAGRREALRVLSMGAAGLALSGCASEQPVGQVGAPIPDDPAYRKLGPRPTYEPSVLAREGATDYSVPSGVIPRRAWATYGPNRRLADPMRRISAVTIHHDGMDAFGSPHYGDAAERLEKIRRSHVGRGWADVGYHFAIDPGGRVWAARPLELQGAHVRDHNEHNIGVLVLGNFERERPSEKALGSLERFVSQLTGKYRLTARQVHTHREWAPTACPGRHLQPFVDRSRMPGGLIAMG
ncbi:MAG: peptidoglycan recognition family protein [Planctomycetota bacterium]